MTKIVGVRFRNAGKSYYFDPKDADLAIGTKVIVETSQGKECGEVSIPPIEVDDEKVSFPLKPILRIASEEDIERVRDNREKEKEAYRICQEKIHVHNLEMKLIDSEYTFDRNKLLFYFTADGRVDFRDLVKDLAAVFRTRIELRQVGVRDETKILGGIGICGRELCCKAYLKDFSPVSIKMAKEQNLSLNPTKISGVCGRLMCCLNNEEETYEFLNKTMPKNGDFATTEEGEVGVIINVNILKQSVAVLFEENDTKEVREYRVEEIRFTPKRYGRPEEVPSVARSREEFKKKQDDEEPDEKKEKISVPNPVVESEEDFFDDKVVEEKHAKQEHRRNRNDDNRKKSNRKFKGSDKKKGFKDREDGSKMDHSDEKKRKFDGNNKKNYNKNRRKNNRSRGQNSNNRRPRNNEG